jgi:glycosyltransferase involved in cell wall biosynthesis
MEDLAFIDHDFHKYTKSGDFLKRIFIQQYKVKHFYISKKLKFDDEIIKYDNFFCFQILPSISFLMKIKSKNIMWAPMYDSMHYPYHFGKTIWDIVEYFNIKVLFFSKKLRKISNNNSITGLDLKFFKKTNKLTLGGGKKIKIFSWNRGGVIRGGVCPNRWQKLFNPKEIDVVYSLGHTNNEIKNIRKISNKVINFKGEFIHKKKFLSLIKKSDVFICPREKEGIGMAHAEAISYSKYLVAHNDATMNEYITNKKIGYLLDKDKGPITSTYILNNQNYRKKNAANGFNIYKLKEKKILKLFQKKIKFKYSFYKELIIKFKHILLCLNWKIKYILGVK